MGDCEVGSTRKACKNCSCGRAEEEEKVKLGLTMDQINNPQSACGNVCLITFENANTLIVFLLFEFGCSVRWVCQITGVKVNCSSF